MKENLTLQENETFLRPLVDRILLSWLKEFYRRLYKKREKENGIKWLKAGIWKLRGNGRKCEKEGATVWGSKMSNRLCY